jgi:hypothetical protein
MKTKTKIAVCKALPDEILTLFKKLWRRKKSIELTSKAF